MLVLAADGSGWSNLPPLNATRFDAAAAVLPDGKVLVAGGQAIQIFEHVNGCQREVGPCCNTAELWDPATQKWSALPPMAHGRTKATACVLPSGRVAVVGGTGPCAHDRLRTDGEVYDPVKRKWEPLGAELASMQKLRTYRGGDSILRAQQLQRCGCGGWIGRSGTALPGFRSSSR
eukprot:COSAG06_NODE_10553_length_1660_cov_1.100577_2_plen_176_part_00